MTHQYENISFGFDEEGSQYFAYTRSVSAFSKKSKEDALLRLANGLSKKLEKIIEEAYQPIMVD